MQPNHGTSPSDSDAPVAVSRWFGSRWLLRHRWSLAILGTLILAATWPLSARLKTDRTIEQMFDRDDPALLAYQELQLAFGGNAVVMLVYRDDDLLTPAGLERAGEISTRVEAIEGVRGVLSVAQLNSVLGLIRPTGLFGGSQNDLPPLLRRQHVDVRAFEKLFTGYTHSENDKVAAVVAMLSEPDRGRGHADVIRKLEEVARSMPDATSDAVLVGEPVLLDRGFDLIERDGNRLAWLTIALLSPCVLLLLRSFRFVFLQIVVILWAVTVTRASLYLMSFELSLVSSILTAIVTVITVTAVIHLGSNQRTLRRRGYAASAAASRTFHLVLPAIFWACATDAAGFISLAVSGVAPVREFGYMMGIASIAVWAGIILFAPIFTVAGPSALWSFPSLDRILEPKLLSNLERKIRKACLLTAVVLVRHRLLAFAVTAGLAAMTSVGISKLEIESSFLRNFRETSPVVQAYQMVESELSGAGVWDVVLDAPDDMTSDYLESVRQLEKKLRAVEVQGQQLTKVLSLADADLIASTVPLMGLASPTIRLSGMRSAFPTFADALLVPPQSDSNNQRKLRIMLRSREHISTETKMALINEVRLVVAEHTGAESWLSHFGNEQLPRAGRVTGY